MKKVMYIVIHMICIFSQARTPLIIAHRGASGYEPENTLRSFERAIALGAPVIELDVHLAKSGEIMVMHDATIDRTTNGTGEVKKLSWKQLQKYQTSKGEHIPLLSEVFDVIQQRATIMIELKDPAAAVPVAELIKRYVQQKEWSYDTFIVTSFDHYAVRAFHASCPWVKTGVIFEGNPIGHADIARRAQAHYAIMAYEWITRDFIADAHASGIEVFVYTVNSKQQAHELKKLKVDGIITNYPDIL